jgi:uncharacterized membrane protein (UPF0127 family)
MKTHRPLPPLFVLCLLAGCQQRPTTASPAGSTLPTVQMKMGNETFTLEVANTGPTKETGLMRRDSMPAGHGMIFVFEQAQNVGFYMKNTRIPLDIVFIDEGGRVISIKQMKPYDLTTVYADGQARWAVELNKGAAAGAGVKVGDKLQIPEPARSAEP